MTDPQGRATPATTHLAKARAELARREAELARREAELEASKNEVAALTPEPTEANRGMIALYAELENARQAEARLASIVHSSDDAMFSMTLTGTIQTWNPSAERLYGYRAAEIIDRPVNQLVPESSRAALERTLTRIRGGRRAKRGDTRHRRKDGSLVDVAVTISAMRDAEESLTGFSAVVRDITQRLQMEAELTTARAEQQVMADRDRIARDLHDMVIQRVFAAGLTLQSTASMVGDAAVEQRLHEVTGELDVTIQELRTAIFNLHGHHLHHEASLRAEILKSASAAAERLGFVPEVTVDGSLDAVPDEVATHLLAVIREALTNVARHARASAADVIVVVGTDLLLRVIDNGTGIGDTTRASGLRNMRERAAALDGECLIGRRAGGGTQVEWRVPLP